VPRGETAALLESIVFDQLVDGALFASTDALSAAGAVEYLRERDVPLLALSGVVSASPLATREAQTVTGLPVIDVAGLRDPGRLEQLMAGRRQRIAA
jgi:hypothetical protein